MRLHGVWVDTVVEKPTIWRCRCGAMLSTQKAMMRHVAGDTMCQHRGEGMVAYVPESFGPEAPGAGSEGAIPKRQAGLHDDELLVEALRKLLLAADRTETLDDELLAAADEARHVLAAVRGAGAEPQEEKLREVLEWIEGFALVGSGADWDRVAGVARKALSAVPLLQDGENDA